MLIFIGSNRRTFVLAGVDTTSNALSRTLQILASNPEAQAKLRAEVLEASNGEPMIDYETIVKLPYLDAVVRETLRVHAPVPVTNRVAMKDDLIPVSEPFVDRDGVVQDNISFVPTTCFSSSRSSLNRDGRRATGSRRAMRSSFRSCN